MSHESLAYANLIKSTVGTTSPNPSVIPVKVDFFNQSFTAFVGGAADKYQFLARPLGLEPPDDIGAGPTGIMAGCMRSFKRKITDDIIRANFEYYGYEEAFGKSSVRKKYNNNSLINLFTDIEDRLQKEPNTQINIVGHSLGAWNVAGLSEELFKKNICKVNTLITIDPVGTRLSKLGGVIDRAKIYYLEPNPVADLWINIYSQPEKNFRDDWIAVAGGRWNDDDTAKADYNSISKFHHGEAEDMFVEKKFNNNSVSASDLLLRELRKVLK